MRMAANMQVEPVAVVSCAEMRELDRRATETFGISVETLMENAGKAVAEESIKFLQTAACGKPWKILIFCGGGNNGGDGLVAARILKQKGAEVKIIFLKPTKSLKGATGLNFERIKNESVPYLELRKMEQDASETQSSEALLSEASRGRDEARRRGSRALAQIEKEFTEAHLFIDALLGTGSKGEVTGLFQETIQCINASGKPVVAVDIPSGLDADSGRQNGTCIRAHLTVTMAAIKKGFLETKAKEWIGKVIVADIGYPQALIPLPAYSPKVNEKIIPPTAERQVVG